MVIEYGTISNGPGEHYTPDYFFSRFQNDSLNDWLLDNEPKTVSVALSILTSESHSQD
jgi:hypothetical protein